MSNKEQPRIVVAAKMKRESTWIDPKTGRKIENPLPQLRRLPPKQR